MENAKSKDLLGEVSYNTYYNIEKFFHISMWGANFLSFLPFPDEVKFTFGGIAGASALSYLVMVFSKGIEHTREINEIHSLYKEFIKNYNVLNQVFDLQDPIQIYAMYNYLVHKGYLSENKQFVFSSTHSRDFATIMGANVMTGRGVCRHLAAMFTDILNDYNIKAGTLGVYVTNITVNIKRLDEPKYTKEELISWLYTHPMDESIREMLMNVVNDLAARNILNLEFEIQTTEKDEKIYEKIYGNHAVTFAYKDGKSYYLDPTQDCIYRLDNGVLSDSKITIFPKKIASLILNNHLQYTNMKKLRTGNYSAIGLEEQEKMQSETLNICKNNMDVFDQFYQNNEELYKETTNKIHALKKRYSILRK